MRGKTCLITGTASGMGRIAAKALAKKGANLILVDFDTENGILAKDEIIQDTGNQAVEYIDCDVSSFTNLRNLSENIYARYSHLDVLINNAGITESSRRESEDGHEMTMATNFLAPFLLSHLLLDLLKKRQHSRIINISSDGHQMAKDVNFKSMNFEQGWETVNHSMGFQAYARSKLCLNAFSFKLSEQLKGTSVDVYAVSPGYFINTN
ncbi:MAG: SDR family NAD(P)-dependent oxidoreductase, partial [Gammaproteobacteria bacterium]|nr:SDR family NAD(P)-dependent oxidoreductase [Gammaproteobacteria bacterium]